MVATTPIRMIISARPKKTYVQIN